MAFTLTLQPPLMHDLTITVNPELAGSTVPAAGVSSYIVGAVVDVSATPASGYVFDHWSGACMGSEACSVTMDGDKNVTANFAINTYTLDYAAGENGILTGETSQMVNYGGNGTTVEAVPNTGYHFEKWSDKSTVNPRTDLNVTANVNVTASFAVNTYTLDYAAGENGILTGETSQMVNYGGNGTTVEAVPNTGYHFEKWSDESTVNPRTDLNVTANVNVTASFAVNTYALTVTQPENGSITPDTGTYNHGDVVVLNAVANLDYTFSLWTGACAGQSNPCSLTMDGPKSVSANFILNTAPVLTLIGDKSVKASNPLSFTATATDAEVPPQTLAFSLGEGAPPGAIIDPVTGDFTWTPVATQAPGIYPVTIIVMDNGTPALSDSELINITVSEWSEDWDAYSDGQQMHGVNGWKGWDNSPAAGALVSGVQYRSSLNAINITGATDLVHTYSGYTSGKWIYTAWQYIPTDFSGQTYFILLNGYKDGGPNNWSMQVNFNSASNLVTNDGQNGGTLPLIKGSWVKIHIEIDLTNDLLTFFYGDQQLYTSSWTGGVSGGGALEIAAIDLFANGSSPVYYDDLSLGSCTGAYDECNRKRHNHPQPES